MRKLLEKIHTGNLFALLWNLLIVYVAYSLCRLMFYLLNLPTYSDISGGHVLDLFGAGLIFDTSAIVYTNAILIIMFLLPLHWKENGIYYKVARWYYTIVNSFCISTNLIDCVYYQYTGKRTTMSVLNEFSNEGFGNMANILGKQFLDNWYLVLLAVLMWWLFYKLFRSPKDLNLKDRLGYYITNAVLFCAAIPLSVAGMRGGFTTATRPITISNANQYAENPSETGIILNTPFSAIRTFNKKPFVTPDYMPEAEALCYFNPVHEPSDTLPFEPKNVVVLIVESYSKQHFGFYNKDLRPEGYPGFTPFLDSLITDSALTFKYSYANGRKSIEGMPSVLSGIPSFVEPLFLTPASLNDMSGLARELTEHKGYYSAFFHGAMNGSMGFEAFANSSGFQDYFGRTEYNEDPNYNGDDDFDGTWAIWDEEFLQFYCDRMSEMKEPFMTALFTASSHTPFNLPERYKDVFPKGEKRIQECVAYTDHALRQFFAKASRQPWFKNTVFVITADHTSNQIDPVYRTSLGYFAVPIIIYAPGDPSLRGYDTEKIVEQSDIMPTILSYLHYDRPYVAFGEDMLSTPADSTFAIHWVAEMESYQLVYGPYAVDFDGERVIHAYNYRKDPLLKENILESMPKDTLEYMEKKTKSIVQQYMQRMNTNNLVVR